MTKSSGRTFGLNKWLTQWVEVPRKPIQDPSNDSIKQIRYGTWLGETFDYGPLVMGFRIGQIEPETKISLLRGPIYQEEEQE